MNWQRFFILTDTVNVVGFWEQAIRNLVWHILAQYWHILVLNFFSTGVKYII